MKGESGCGTGLAARRRRRARAPWPQCAAQTAGHPRGGIPIVRPLGGAAGCAERASRVAG
eukprot:scaffold38047_cov32-Tisochrysis_lutea.AAC.5